MLLLATKYLHCCQGGCVFTPFSLFVGLFDFKQDNSKTARQISTILAGRMWSESGGKPFNFGVVSDQGLDPGFIYFFFSLFIMAG